MAPAPVSVSTLLARCLVQGTGADGLHAIAPCLPWRHPAWHGTLPVIAPCLAWHSAWHGRYKAPFLAALRAEVAAGRLGRARSSLDRFWAPLVEQEGLA